MGGAMTQTQEILRYLKDHGAITPVDAMREFGCMRLAARIADLKAKGHKINTTMVSSMNRYGKAVSYAKYTLGGAE